MLYFFLMLSTAVLCQATTLQTNKGYKITIIVSEAGKDFVKEKLSSAYNEWTALTMPLGTKAEAVTKSGTWVSVWKCVVELDDVAAEAVGRQSDALTLANGLKGDLLEICNSGMYPICRVEVVTVRLPPREYSRGLNRALKEICESCTQNSESLKSVNRALKEALDAALD